MNYIISDTHFGHKKLVEWGERKKGFEKEYIGEINRTVRFSDTLIHLGDFCLGKVQNQSHTGSIGYWRHQIAARIILIKGNHDSQPDLWYMSNGFDLCVKKLELEVKGKRIILTHEPYQDPEVDVMIHGHLHGNGHRLNDDLKDYPFKDKTEFIDISDSEKFGFKPISLEELI